MSIMIRRTLALLFACVLYSHATYAETTGRIVFEPELAWEFDSASPIYGDPAVRGDLAYLTNTTGMVYALNRFTGELVWQYSSSDAIYSGVGLGDAAVYFLSDDGYSHKLDADSGELLWRTATANYMERTPLLVDYGNWDYRSARPIESDGRVYVGSGSGIVYALDADSGESIWQYQGDGAVRVDTAVTDEFVIAATFNGFLYCLDKLSGELVWQYDIRTGFDGAQQWYAINSPPSVFGDTVYVGTRNTNLYALDLLTGEVEWMFPYVSSWAESPVSYYDGSVYVGSSFLRAQFSFSADDGSVQWRQGGVRGLSYAGLVPTENALYTGTVAVPGMQSEGFLTDGGLLRLNRHTGEQDWFYPLPQGPFLNEFGVISTPVVTDELIYVAGLDGVLRAVEEVAQEFPILNFSVDRDELKPKEKTWLRWNVIDGHRVYLNGRRVPKQGKRPIRLRESATYTLTVKGRLQESQTVAVDVKPAGEINIARFGTAVATSNQDPFDYDAQKAIDGNPQTRWASSFNDGQAITLDLGKTTPLGRMVINWEGAYASAYLLEVSTDGHNWTLLRSVEDSDGGVDEFDGLNVDSRYLRLTGVERATVYGISIYELEVYEREDVKSCRGGKRGKRH